MITVDNIGQIAGDRQVASLAEWMHNPLDDTEWVDGQLIKKTGMTLKHSRIQARLAYQWKTYAINNNIGGEVYTEAPCRTIERGRKPDVAYLTPELVAQFGEVEVLPQSFPLIAEVISPTDRAEEIFTKVAEYLQSGGMEVWLLLPDSHLVIVSTPQQQTAIGSGKVVRTESVLTGFSMSVDDLLA